MSHATRWIAVTMTALLGALVLFAGSATVPGEAARADSRLDGLPTWDEVEAAKQDTKAAERKIGEIEALISQMQAEVEAAQARAEEAADKAIKAEQAFVAAYLRAEELKLHAEESERVAQEAADQAAAIVSQMYRSGGIDRNVELFLQAEDGGADEFLDRLAMMTKATERNNQISLEAERARNNAASLGEQAEDAQEERERLHDIAQEEAMVAAQAADEARLRLEEQQAAAVQLELQLEALKDQEAETVAGYEERQRVEAIIAEEKRRAEEEARRKAEEEARRRAEEERRRQQEEQGQNPSPAPPPSSGGGGSGGWYRPMPGGSYWISTEWWGYWGHLGIDMASPAWTPIFAASGGTVNYAGVYGGCGIMVQINHGGGIQTRYCHMVDMPPVYNGQWVAGGQVIGYVGSTGNSTGPHLHFETLVGGVQQNPRPFMNARGIWL